MSDEQELRSRKRTLERVAALLREHGSATTQELEAIDPAAVRRVNDLKNRHGWDIRTEKIRSGMYRYVVHGVPAAIAAKTEAVTPEPVQLAKAQQKHLF